MASTKTPLPDPAVLAEFGIVAAGNARRLLTDAEHLLTRGGWPTAYSVAVLAFEEAGKSWLCLVGMIMPGGLKAEFPFGELVGSHLYKLQAARMIAPLLAFLKGGPDAAVASFTEAIDAMESLARRDNLAKQRGLYADCADGIIWDPSQIKRDEARAMVAGVRDLLDRIGPLTDPGFLRFVAAPPDDAKAELDDFLGRFITRAREDDLAGAMSVLAEMHALMPGVGEMFEQDARRMAIARAQGTRTQTRKLPKSKRQGKSGPPGRDARVARPRD
jgi:AbiV family abortive infection protein